MHTCKIADTRSEILSAARELFAQRGYHGTSIRAIAARASANLGAVNYHFGSKQALYRAVLDPIHRLLLDRVVAGSRKPGGGLERIAWIVRTFFDFFEKNPDVPEMIMHELLTPQSMSEISLQIIRSYIDVLVPLIREGQGDGSVRSGDPQLMALSVLSQPMMMAARVLRETALINSANRWAQSLPR